MDYSLLGSSSSGMSQRAQFLILLLLTGTCLFLLLQMRSSNVSRDNSSFHKGQNSAGEKKKDVVEKKEFGDMYNEWNECMMKSVSKYRNNHTELWGNLWKAVQECEKLPSLATLKILDFSNSDETKRSILPKIQEPSVIVTLGVGHDTAAEEKIQKVLPPGSLFFGADPIQDINEKLYTKLGLYFPFAVGANAGMSQADVLIGNAYTKKTVVHVDLIYFLKNIIKKRCEFFYDDVWIDAEGAEYDLFPFFDNGGELDQNQITFCMFNMEVHNPTDEQKKLFHEFTLRILRDGRYAFFRPVQASHIRLFYVNFDDQRCAKKYIL
ncbi:unnamed protein product [Caenorhabditis auriculariae]|uniref:Methyltransferase FkbM domain-containing protein n=1 Tax=Caenorhabditis auriculariae TaxID=2777116 RepID=A0A8S1HGE7_9PELO|nr:unnamed protein product [Caenorhabditis auriculariae]